MANASTDPRMASTSSCSSTVTSESIGMLISSTSSSVRSLASSNGASMAVCEAPEGTPIECPARSLTEVRPEEASAWTALGVDWYRVEMTLIGAPWVISWLTVPASA